MSSLYDNIFFDNIFDSSKRAAECIMPIIIEKLNPHSIVDIGCGRGVFLAEAKKYGVNVLGIDGDYVDRDTLCIDQSEFFPHDVGKKISLPQKYDVAMSFEVAEHIDPNDAEQFVDNLVLLSDIIVFSAAIPRQGGTNHVNEQWPSYWQEKFKRRGYIVSSCLRNCFWNNSEITAWRRQNLLLVIREELFEEIEAKFDKDMNLNMDIVHPDFFSYKLDSLEKRIMKLEEREKRKQELLETAIDYKKLAKCLNEKTVSDLIVDFDVMESFILNTEFVDNFKQYQLEDLEGKKHKEEYILWGAGADGRKIASLLKSFGKKISIWCDTKMAGTIVDDFEIVSPEEMYQKYNNEIIIVASRKYQKEIIKQIISKKADLKEKILNFNM